MPQFEHYDAVIIGAGFSGMYMLFRLRGIGMSAKVFERGDDVGGTWHWNRYPGARCDCESVYYSYSFSPELEQEWHWTERYPSQPEILSYLRHVADRFDLRRDIRFSTSVISARYDESEANWVVATDDGRQVSARIVISAVGCLSVLNKPAIAGAETFAGPQLHTGAWPHEDVDLTGKRVAVIGTGASGIQAIPVIADRAGHLTVFQRTPQFTIPARNRPMDEEFERRWKAHYRAWRRVGMESRAGIPYPPSGRSALDDEEEERSRVYEAAWEDGGLMFGARSYSDLQTSLEANATAVRFVHRKIEEIVRDPAVAEALKPTDFPFGAKRLPLDTNYYETFNRPNVDLVDLRRTPIAAITPTGIETAGARYEVDVIIYATGFDAMTGALLAIDIRGKHDASLREEWAAGPHTYLGLAVAGFPNFFMITGPGSPSVLSNMPVSIEQHAEWICECIEHLRKEGLASIEARREDQEAWTAHVTELASHTLYPLASSWYLGANVPGKPRVFMPYLGGVAAYRHHCDQVAAHGYEGFVVARAQPADSVLAGEQTVAGGER
jgi:cyclohexanone monooxygenase